MATGRMLIAAERQRQIDSEGWTPEHDDQHGARSLELAALCYRNKHAAKEGCGLPDLWPWDKQWWKPKGYQRNLERAGALYLAAAEVAERAGDYQYHNKLLEDSDTCASEINAIILGKSPP